MMQWVGSRKNFLIKGERGIVKSCKPVSVLDMTQVASHKKIFKTNTEDKLSRVHAHRASSRLVVGTSSEIRREQKHMQLKPLDFIVDISPQVLDIHRLIRY